MHRWLTVLFVFTILALSASMVFSQTKGAPGGQYLTVQDVEKITGLHGVKLVPPDASKGAGGDLNFANKDGKLILMVNRNLYSDMLYTQTKNMKDTVKEEIQGVGDAAFERSRWGGGRFACVELNVYPDQVRSGHKEVLYDPSTPNDAGGTPAS